MRSMRSCKCILLGLRHIAPPIIYYDAPMSYMTENPAQKFYDGVPPPEDQISQQKSHQEGVSQKVINYCVVQPRYEYKIPRSQYLP